jgi:hypothetical protein
MGKHAPASVCTITTSAYEHQQNGHDVIRQEAHEH